MSNYIKIIRLILIQILAAIFLQSLYGQDYSIDHKQIHVISQKKKYEVKITYPFISNLPQHRGINYLPYYGFNNLIRNKMEAERDSFIVWMKDWEINEYTKDFTSEYEINDYVYYADDKLISVHFSLYSYFAGAAHPNNSSFSVNYDLENSKEVFLRDLLLPGWETKISEICIREITKQKKEMGIEPDEWVNEGAGPKPENFKVFNIKKDSLVITFPTYQVGAYVEGPSEVVISYAEIKDIINPKGTLKSFLK